MVDTFYSVLLSTSNNKVVVGLFVVQWFASDHCCLTKMLLMAGFFLIVKILHTILHIQANNLKSKRDWIVR